MSLANRTANAAGHPPTLCPYCAHVSPLDSKFCNECGAALHLVPCPQCGSISDITQTSNCSRCNCALHVSAFALSDFPDLPAAPKDPDLPPVLVAASIDSVVAEHAPTPQTPPPSPLKLEASSGHWVLPRPRAVLVGGLLLITVAAAAGYLLSQQRDEPVLARPRSLSAAASPPRLTPAPTPTTARAIGPADAASTSAALISEATAAVPVPLVAPAVRSVPAPLAASAAPPRPLQQSLAATPATSPTTVAAVAPTLKPQPNGAVPPALAAAANHSGTAVRGAVFKGGSANLNRTWPAASDAAEIAQAAQASQAAQLQLRSRARIEAGAGLDLPVSNIGPCTPAVAALGLCAAPVKQIPPQ